jgi:hypothetical protein
MTEKMSIYRPGIEIIQDNTVTTCQYWEGKLSKNLARIRMSWAGQREQLSLQKNCKLRNTIMKYIDFLKLCNS